MIKLNRSKAKIKKICFMIVFSAFIMSFCGGDTIFAAEETPQAWFVPFSTSISASAETKSSRVYEVKTSGFAKEAYLEYQYINNMMVRYRLFISFPSGKTDVEPSSMSIFRTNQTADNGTDIPNIQVLWTGGTSDFKPNFRYFAIRAGERGEGQVTITVKDTNKRSSTYGKVATSSFNSTGWSDQAADINAGAGSMWAGETQELRYLLATGGVPMEPHMAAWYNSHTDGFKMLQELEGTTVTTTETIATTGGQFDWKYDFQSLKSGHFNMNIGQKRNVTELIRLDPFYTNHFMRDDFPMAYGTFDVYVFDEPSISSTPRKIFVRGTKAGITYSVGSESYLCTKDGQEIVFGKEAGTDGFLMPGGQYQVELSKKVNGKKAVIIKDIETNGYNHVYMNSNGVNPDAGLGTINLKYQEEKLGVRKLSAPGYTFLGWNTKADGSGIEYTSNMTVQEENLTLYAQWYKKHYKANIYVELNNNPYVIGEVGLYQDGKEIYKLNHLVGEAGHYFGTNIEYSKYLDGNVAYDIYVDGVDTTVNHKITGREDDLTVINTDVYMFDASVDLRQNKNPWKNQNVILNQSGKEFNLTYNELLNRYTARFMYDNNTPDDRDYLIFLNDKIIQNGSDVQKINISNDLATNNLVLNFYDVEMDVRKDDVAWSDAEVTLKQNGQVAYKLNYDSVSEKFVYQGIVDFGQDYNVFVSGTNLTSKEDIGIKFNLANPSGTKKYNTVEFKDSQDLSKIYSTQILYSGVGARKPITPIKQGSTFRTWNIIVGGVEENPFAGGATVTAPITVKTEILAMWQDPSLKLNTILRCNENGDKDGKGLFYRMPNIAIMGFPKGDALTPILTAEFISPGSTINVVANEAYTVKNNNTDSVTIFFKNRLPMNVAEEYLSKNVIVKPQPKINHQIKGRVFGVTG